MSDIFTIHDCSLKQQQSHYSEKKYFLYDQIVIYQGIMRNIKEFHSNKTF
jgi:hypothetical protein